MLAETIAAIRPCTSPTCFRATNSYHTPTYLADKMHPSQQFLRQALKATIRCQWCSLKHLMLPSRPRQWHRVELQQRLLEISCRKREVTRRYRRCLIIRMISLLDSTRLEAIREQESRLIISRAHTTGAPRLTQRVIPRDNQWGIREAWCSAVETLTRLRTSSTKQWLKSARVKGVSWILFITRGTQHNQPLRSCSLFLSTPKLELRELLSQLDSRIDPWSYHLRWSRDIRIVRRVHRSRKLLDYIRQRSRLYKAHQSLVRIRTSTSHLAQASPSPGSTPCTVRHQMQPLKWASVPHPVKPLPPTTPSNLVLLPANSLAHVSKRITKRPSIQTRPPWIWRSKRARPRLLRPWQWACLKSKSPSMVLEVSTMAITSQESSSPLKTIMSTPQIFWCESSVAARSKEQVMDTRLMSRLSKSLLVASMCTPTVLVALSKYPWSPPSNSEM